MPFPEASRIVFKRNPLDLVVCQLRFPPILKVDTEIPSEFQERIKGAFPNLSDAMDFKVEVPIEAKGHLPPEVISQIVKSSTGLKNYEFSTDDEVWKVNLTRHFLALSTKEYIKWERFKERLTTPLQALKDIYSPTSFSRIGLRYVDVIRRSTLGLEDKKWSELLQPFILGMLAEDRIADEINSFQNRLDIDLPDNQGSARILSKLGTDLETGEICFVIDSDFFTDVKIGTNLVWDKLDYFNKRASWLIQWCLKDPLKEAMEPEKI